MHMSCSVSSLSLSNANHYHPLIPCQQSLSNVTVPLFAKVTDSRFKVTITWQKDNNNNGFVVGCASWGLVTELERELEAEMKSQEDHEEKGRSGMTRFRHKCGERKGVMELLECLESEAIMGEDVGKEPTDYNRRAQIFDRSSRVFQALKELNNDVFPPQQSPPSKEVT